MLDIIDGLGMEDIVLCMDIDWSLGLLGIFDFKI